MDITVRYEEIKDYRRTEEIAREAFWNQYFPGAAEHVLIACLNICLSMIFQSAQTKI